MEQFIQCRYVEKPDWHVRYIEIIILKERFILKKGPFIIIFNKEFYL